MKASLAPAVEHDVRLDGSRRSLMVGENEHVLDPRSFAVLSIMMDRFGQYVGKDELMARAWPDRIVADNSLAKLISKLRRLLASSSLEIVAAYGVGYILRVSQGHRPKPRGDAQPPDATEAISPLRRRWRPAAAMFGSGALATALMIGIVRDRSAEPVRTAAPLTHDAPDAVATILWVDDHPSNNRLEVAALKRRHVAVHLAETSEDALNLLAMNRYRLVVSDLGRGEDRLAGLKMIATMRDRGISVPVVIYTLRPKYAAGQDAQRQLVARAGAADLAVTPTEVRAKVFGRIGLTGAARTR